MRPVVPARQGYFGTVSMAQSTTTVRIANGAGFLGDWLDAPRRLVDAAEVDFLTLEYLAELTLSILARARQKNPAAGYAQDLIHALRSLTPALERQPQLRLVTNGGGMNPRAAARAAGEVLTAAGQGGSPIGVVTGDDLLERLPEILASGCDLANLETGQPLRALQPPVVSANVYLGARPIAAALAAGARHVLTGRVADASLTLGPALHTFGDSWNWDDWNLLAAASVAGHLIECGAQVTGGYMTDWPATPLADVGYPIAELASDGSCTITKPAGTEGRVTRQTVVEQLIYEIGDPRHYLTPDVDCDFTTVEVTETAADRVLVRGATGGPAPPTLKVSLAYAAGFASSAQLVVFGSDCLAKAHECAEIVWKRLARVGLLPQRRAAELLATGSAVPGLRPSMAGRSNPHEVVLRLAVSDAQREPVERFTREIAPLITSGPAGLAGYAVGRSDVRPVLAYWPALIPRGLVEPKIEVRPAAEWA